MNHPTYNGDLKKGQKVKFIDYDISKTTWQYGTIYTINKENTKATIKRDDKKTGGGSTIPDYPETGTDAQGWLIEKRQNIDEWDYHTSPLTNIEEIKQNKEIYNFIFKNQ